MEKDEALADAIAQFKSQGVDLTNIDTSGADREDQRRATSAAIELLREAVTTKDGTPDEIKCRIALLDLTYACRVDKQEVLLVEEEEKEEEGKEDGDANEEAEVEEEEEEEVSAAEGNGVYSGDAGGLGGTEVAVSSKAARKSVFANQTTIAMAQGPLLLAALLGHEPLVEETLTCVAAVCDKSVECRDAFPAQGMAVIAKIIQVQSELAQSAAKAKRTATPGKDAAGEGAGSAGDVPTTPEEEEAAARPLNISIKACNAVSVLTHKTENNKQGFVRKESAGLDALLSALTTFGDQSAHLVREACVALRSVCTFDDLRKDFAGAFDAAKAAVKAGCVVELLRLGKLHNADPDCVAAVFFALRAIACNDEAVQQISAGGGLAMAERHLETHAGHGTLCRQATALLRNLAGNDSVKTSLCSVKTLGLLLACVGPNSPHAKDAALAEHVVATFAAMALRVPSNCDRILACGGGRAVTTAMRRFPKVVPLQRNCCLAVRNLVGRSPQLREKLLEDGMEELLRLAGSQSGSVDAAFAALRDLGLEAEMVTVDPVTGEVRKGVEMFGEVQTGFRPVYDDDPAQDAAREARIAAAAKTPKELGYKM